MKKAGFYVDALNDPSIEVILENTSVQVPEAIVAVKPKGHFNCGVLCLTQDFKIFAKRHPFRLLPDIFVAEKRDDNSLYNYDFSTAHFGSVFIDGSEKLGLSFSNSDALSQLNVFRTHGRTPIEPAPNIVKSRGGPQL
ncbi:MAG: hypothetical protein GW903_05405 [Alphaproteobacteria bacterium]|nr:hypothetical protein [Alphaproteobacteria bacterium]NCQ88974.1 hypothetical protein [Alphaproteobacteria bacterium]NCT07875.1 hypothetical protein [Alphaproteobacteria bacterium]